MTDSENPGPSRPRSAERRGSRQRTSSGKRERLVASAAELLHRNGVGATSLAGIAQLADVPLGNVYYYYRTKDELVRAVLAAQNEQVAAMVDGFADLPGPAERLKALASRWDLMRDVVARYGCPFGCTRPASWRTSSRTWAVRSHATSLSPCFPRYRAAPCWPQRSATRNSCPDRYASFTTGSTHSRPGVFRDRARMPPFRCNVVEG